MKRFLPLLLLLSLNAVSQEKYSLKFKIKGVTKDTCFLINYFGDKQYIQDTAIAKPDGSIHFEGDKELKGGIYLVLLPSKKYFEFIIAEKPVFSMESDTADLVKNMKVKGSQENQLFYEYLNFISVKQKEVEPWRNLQKTVRKENKDSVKLVTDKLSAIDKEVKEFKLKFVEKHPNTFVSKLFNAMQEPEVPETPMIPGTNKKDSTFAYRYFKTHYFDGMDFTDDRMLRTPVFHNKMKFYLENLTPQHWDSIKVSADYLLEKAKTNQEVFRYILQHITYTYETSKVMGMDAVFVHMGLKYYKTGRTPWVDTAQLRKIVERAEQLDKITIGKVAPNLRMVDTSLGRTGYKILHQVPAKYTVLYFWDPDCSHCQKETPKLRDLYNGKWKGKGIEVFAVGSISDVDEWKKYIREKKLPWINVVDQNGENKAKHVYDIYSTPVIYLLDEKKKIIAKRLDVEQLDGFLDRKMKEKK